MKQIEFATEEEALAFRDACDAAYPWEGKRGADEHAVLVEKHPTEDRWCAVVGVRLIPIFEKADLQLPKEPTKRPIEWELKTPDDRKRYVDRFEFEPSLMSAEDIAFIQKERARG